MRKARATPAISPFRTTTAAASFAASVPEPNEIPRSAEARAGASLVPSPAMATRPGTVPIKAAGGFALGFDACLDAGDAELGGDDASGFGLIASEEFEIDAKIL